MKNFVPLPYRRVAVREADFPLTERALQENLLGREAYRRTEFIVLRRGAECAIAHIEKENLDDLFSPITSVELFAPTAGVPLDGRRLRGCRHPVTFGNQGTRGRLE